MRPYETLVHLPDLSQISCVFLGMPFMMTLKIRNVDTPEVIRKLFSAAVSLGMYLISTGTTVVVVFFNFKALLLCK